MAKEPFWETKRLDELSAKEWEQLCDGCAQCCLVKLEDAESGDIAYTDVACALLDIGACRCRDYAHRSARVPGCLRLDPDQVRTLGWLPQSCAYRLVAEGRALYWWHPLVSGDPETVHQAGVSVRAFAVEEIAVRVRELEDRVRPLPGQKRVWR
ncbi:MAG: YcgN family cysteine cluster protein [Hyphomicrobiales bacterium]|nr:YcgN family cysteine cluster protein [Hyphomicrobiales bacterium]